MNRNNETERKIDSTIEGLPPPFMIFGKKKEHNPLEDFWMSKLESIEKQYNEHIVKLERSLLEDGANKRQLNQKQKQITRLKDDLNEKTEKLEKLTKQTGQLENKLSLQKYNTKSLKGRLSKVEEVKSKVLKSLEDERNERIRREREISALKLRLSNLERDKKFLIHEVSIKESEKGRVQEREAKLAQNKWNLIKSLTDIDQERRVQTNANVQLVESMGHLLDVGKSQEFKLLKQRKEIDMILEGMKQKRQEHEDALRKLGIRDKEILEADTEIKNDKENMNNLERQVRHWKEEFKFNEMDGKHKELEIKDLQRENSRMRCQLAEVKEKLNLNSSKMKSLDKEKKRTEIELEKAKGQARALHLLMCRNELVKQKLANKILKKHPTIKTTLEQKAKENVLKGRQRYPETEGQQRREIESYKKKIWNLERQKRDLDRGINEAKSRDNRLKLKLDKYSGMEEQVLWTEKAMVKLQGDRNRMEQMLKNMALNVPKKLPFEKLVTDPSILDRMSKYQILQKRLLQQSAKVEELKRNAVKIMEYRKRKTEEDDFMKKERDIPPWRLSHWRHSSEDTLADIDNQLLDPDGVGAGGGSNGERTLPERKYYNEYISYLDTEIPTIKQQIALLERKQQYKEQQLLDVERKSRSRKQDGEEPERDGSLDSEAALKPIASATDEGLLEGLLEIEGEDEDDEDEEDEQINQDSDIDGLLAVVSIDEPSSARKPSESSIPDSRGSGHDNGKYKSLTTEKDPYNFNGADVDLGTDNENDDDSPYYGGKNEANNDSSIDNDKDSNM